MCFPYKDGGYLVLTGYNSTSLREYKTYTYKDGNLTESNYRLPLCPLSELQDPEKTNGREQAIAALEEVFKKTPQYVATYNVIDNPDFQELTILYSLSWDANLPNEVRNQVSNVGTWQNNPKYKWDGEQFVRK